ncbi:MAG: hypothetical protein ACXWT8_16770 [Methylobacter sp.]
MFIFNGIFLDILFIFKDLKSKLMPLKIRRIIRSTFIMLIYQQSVLIDCPINNSSFDWYRFMGLGNRSSRLNQVIKNKCPARNYLWHDMFIANCCNYKDVSETRVSADLLVST